MNWLQPHSVASRAAALGMLGVLVGVGWIGAIAPVVKLYDDNNQAMAEQVQLLAGFRSVIAQSRQAGPESSTSSLDRYREDFLTGPEDAIIVADLQTRLSAVISARNAELSSARALPPKTRDGLDYLGLGLQIRAEMKDIQSIIYAIETGKPLLFVERADLRLDDRGAVAGRAHNVESIAPMVIELAVYGAKWPGLAVVPKGRSGAAPGAVKAP